MKICPSCSARLGDDVSVCSSCEYRFDAGREASDSGAKKTMMGLPALTDYRPGAKKEAPAEQRGSGGGVGATLFGLPALNLADAFSEPSEADDATSMLSAKALSQVLDTEKEPAVGGKLKLPKPAGVGGQSVGQQADSSKMTAFGMRAPTIDEMRKGHYIDPSEASFDDDSDDHVFDDAFGASGLDESPRQRLSGSQASEVSAALRGWGLDEYSEEHSQETQVFGSDLLQRSGFGGAGSAEAIGFDTDEDFGGAKHTIMGMAVDSEAVFNAKSQRDQFTDVTRSVNPDDLFGSKELLDASGLPQNIRDQVRGETLARQTTSLNVPSIRSTPASGLVRARTESGQSLRAMIDTPVMHMEEDVVVETRVAALGRLGGAPASGVFKKLKRRLEAEAADGQPSGGDGVDVSGVGVYQIGTDPEPSATGHQGSELKASKPSAFSGSTLSSMADELASIPAMADEFAAVMSTADEIAVDAARPEPEFALGSGVESAFEEKDAVLREESAFGGLSEDVAAVKAEEVFAPEPAVAAAVVVEEPAADVAFGGAAALVNEIEQPVLQEKPKAVVSLEGVKAAPVEQAAVNAGKGKFLVLAILAVLVIVGIVVVVLLK